MNQGDYIMIINKYWSIFFIFTFLLMIYSVNLQNKKIDNIINNKSKIIGEFVVIHDSTYKITSYDYYKKHYILDSLYEIDEKLLDVYNK